MEDYYNVEFMQSISSTRIAVLLYAVHQTGVNVWFYAATGFWELWIGAILSERSV